MSDIIETRHKIISHAPTDTYREGYENINWHKAGDSKKAPKGTGPCPIGPKGTAGPKGRYDVPASDAFRRATGR